MLMRILLLGGGGREHALAVALARSDAVERILWAPGNGGRADKTETRALDATDTDAVLDLVREEAVDFVVIGPEAPLDAGVSDALIAAGVAVFGPSRAAAMLEISKSFAKEICDAAGAPTARWRRFEAAAPALAQHETTGAPGVVKAAGLAAGNGVTVAETIAEARSAVATIFAGGAQGAVVIEEFLTGEEASLFALVNGTEIRLLGAAQDHKRAFEGDLGPNTGGMGAYAPAPVATEAAQTRALDEILRPVAEEMARRGAPYRGVLFAGLMIEDGRPRLIEFNARFGDPEAQTLLPLLRSDLLPMLLAASEGGERLGAPTLGAVEIAWEDAASLSVVMATKGYPGAYPKGEEIGGLDALADRADVAVYHAGTRRENGRILANGGRVLTVVGRGKRLENARAAAYDAVDAIDWPGGFCRRDIGWRALSGGA